MNQEKMYTRKDMEDAYLAGAEKAIYLMGDYIGPDQAQQLARVDVGDGIAALLKSNFIQMMRKLNQRRGDK